MRLLVVDDDAFVRVLLCLDLPEVELIEVTRVQEAIAVFQRRERIDGLIVDLRLADGDGLEVVRQARSRGWTRNLPIVVLTAGYDEADAAEVYMAGADAYLAKPFVAGEVLSIIEHVESLDLTERRSRRRRLARGVEVVEMQPRVEDAVPGTPRRFWRRSPAPQ
jgi:CheY-like chemotaxis protein